tara:strand:- start:163529 stop:164308 length:780 start_codon:yes stop_codon:yes gene_type:complete
VAFETIKLERKENIGILTINRPKAMNALNHQVIEELKTVLSQLLEDPVRCLVLTGAGDKSFVAGADIKEMETMDSEGAKRLSANGQSAFNLMEQMSFPVIAAVNGFALGGGFELALCCDFIIASEKAKFGLPEVGLGLIPGYGGTQRLSRTVGLNNCRRMALSGGMFSAETLFSYGAVSEVVPPDQVLERATAIAKEIASKGPKAVEFCKRSINDGYQKTLNDGLLVELDYFSQAFGTDDKTEGVTAFIEKRAPEFLGK